MLFHRDFDPRTDPDAWALQALQCALPDNGTPIIYFRRQIPLGSRLLTVTLNKAQVSVTRTRYAKQNEALRCRQGSTVQQALEFAASHPDSPWEPPGESLARCNHTIGTTYSQLVTMKHIPPTKNSFFQVCCSTTVLDLVMLSTEHIRVMAQSFRVPQLIMFSVSRM